MGMKPRARAAEPLFRRLSETQVIERHFDGAGHAPLLGQLRKLGTRTDSKRKTDEQANERILAAISKAQKAGHSCIGPLLFSLTQEQKPLLGSVLDRFDLDREERAQVLAQFVTDATDDRYPMLDLSRQELKRVPDEIALVHVPPANVGSDDDPIPYREINLGYNRIRKLRDRDFDALNHFEAIHLIALKLGALPDAISRLTNAIMINISWSDITEFPPETYELTRLKALKLNWTSVTNFSPKIAKLKDLVFLEVCETPFLRTIYSLQDAGGKATTDMQRRVRKIQKILDDLDCRIDE